MASPQPPQPAAEPRTDPKNRINPVIQGSGGAKFSQVAVVGAGAFGTVLTNLLAENQVAVTLWGRDPQQMQTLRQTRHNPRYLMDLSLHPNAGVTHDPADLADADLWVSAVPTQATRDVWERLRDHLHAGVPVVTVAKGMENGTGLLPAGVLEDVLPPGHRVAALSGPSVAQELAQRLPATLTAATPDATLARRLQQTFHSSWFRVYTHPDRLGVELAGALKNVIALAAGILDGLGLGINAKSALLARGLAEITRLGRAMGAQADTFAGVTGVGDLATTCFSSSGRNRSAGERLGRGDSLAAALEASRGVVEGVPTARVALELAEIHRVEMPICQAVAAVLFDGLPPRDAVQRLMTRDLKPEQA